MTTIHPETQIVASRFDPLTRVCSYTYQHGNGERYTVAIPLDELNGSGKPFATREHRRKFLAQKIINHVQINEPDKADIGVER